jgi:hypothetical protein
VVPFALVNPSRTAFAALPVEALLPEERKVRAFLEARGIRVTMLHNTWYSTVTKTQWEEDLPGGGHKSGEKDDVNNADSKMDED